MGSEADSLKARDLTSRFFMEKITKVATLQAKIKIATKNKTLTCSKDVCGSVARMIRPSPAREIINDVHAP